MMPKIWPFFAPCPDCMGAMPPPPLPTPLAKTLLHQVLRINIENFNSKIRFKLNSTLILNIL